MCAIITIFQIKNLNYSPNNGEGCGLDVQIKASSHIHAGEKTRQNKQVSSI